MAYDRVYREVVLFGGYPGPDESGPNLVAETWTWDGVNWQRRTPARTPAVATGTRLVMTPDPVGFRLLLPGWIGLWAWKDREWSEAAPMPSVLVDLRGGSLSWDPLSNGLLVFGGASLTGSFVEGSRIWQPPPINSWREASDPPQASLRVGPSAALDPTVNRVLLFGGLYYEYVGPNLVRTFFNDTWLWNGANWIKQTPAASPDARWKAMMATDEARGQIVLFGGADRNDGVLGDTWIWPR